MVKMAEKTMGNKMYPGWPPRDICRDQNLACLGL